MARVVMARRRKPMRRSRDRKSTRLNSSHSQISYAVFCLKKKKKTHVRTRSSRARSVEVRTKSRPSFRIESRYRAERLAFSTCIDAPESVQNVAIDETPY